MGLQVLLGGLDPLNYEKYRFIGGSVTDTRLMGVLGLYLHWTLTLDSGEPEDLYQYYYYDIEELGLDSIKLYSFKDVRSAYVALKASFGGLGARMVAVNEKEARYLVNSFIEETKRRKQPLPPEVSELGFITHRAVHLSEDELVTLQRKMCTPVVTDYGIVNYYLMRCFGKDEEGAALLRSRDALPSDFEDVSMEKHATFLKNSVRVSEDFSYISESLVESGNSYSIVVSELRLQNNTVCSARRLFVMPISVMEASLILTSSEFVSVFEIISQMDRFDRDFSSLSIGTTKTEHETGTMYMCFKPDNSHVEKSEFRLADDIFAIFYVTDYGQLIVGTYSMEDMISVSKLLSEKETAADICLTSKYNFAQSVIYEFAQSDYTDFDDFVDDLQ